MNKYMRKFRDLVCSKVAVIMPGDNGGNYLAEAVQSVLDQSYKNIEVIIVDDGSIEYNTGDRTRICPIGGISTSRRPTGVSRVP